MNIFHSHKFDGEKWVAITKSDLLAGHLLTTMAPLAVFRNVCAECGEIVFKAVREGINT